MTRFRDIEDFRSWVHPSSVPLKNYRWSVGFYRGRKRVVIAWFEDEMDAVDYCARCRHSRLDIKYDYLQSMF